MKHARTDYNRIQDPAVKDKSLLKLGATPIGIDEPVFLLRAQDRTAAMTLRFWAFIQKAFPDYDPKAVALAEEHARLMDEWPHKKTSDV